MENNANLSSSSQATNALPVQAFGKVLQQAREQKHMSLDDAAKALFILKRHLQAIEADDYAALPQQTFARGFVINYAKFLGVDSVAMAQIFDANYPDHLKPINPADIRSPMQPISTLQRESRRKIKLNPVLIVGLLLALGLGVFVFKTISKAHNDTQVPLTGSTIITPQDQASGASLGSTGSAITPTNPAQANQTNLNNSGSAIGNVGSAIVSLDSAQAPQVTSDLSTIPIPMAATTTASTDASELEFWVQNNTHLNVTDATGAVLVQGEKQRGGFKLNGQPPFKINIDNVSNVKLNFNKEPIKLAQYAQNNQASFSLK